MSADASSREISHRPLRTLYGAAAFVIVTAGVQAAAGIVTPVLLAGFLAIIFAPALFALRGRGIPNLLAIPLLAAPVVLAAVMLSLLLDSSFATLQRNLGTYQRRLEDRKQEILGSLRKLGAEIPADISFGELDPSQIGRWTTQAMPVLRNIVTVTVLVMVLLLITLLEAAGLGHKLKALGVESTGGVGRAREILTKVRYYLMLKTFTSALTGVLLFVMLWLLGIDFPLLWGCFAFALNYVPTIGSIVAAIPPVTLAWIMNGGPTALVVAAGYTIINVVIGNVLEPIWMGKGVGLSPLVVLLSLLFWGFVLGPIGMLLSVPLTMTCKIILEADSSTRWLAILLGPNSGGDARN